MRVPVIPAPFAVFKNIAHGVTFSAEKWRHHLVKISFREGLGKTGYVERGLATKCAARRVLHVSEVPPLAQDFEMLRERQFDFVIARSATPHWNASLGDELNVEVLIDDPLVVVTGRQSRWAGRSKIDLAELSDAEWILTPPDTSNYQRTEEAFRARGLDMPNWWTASS